MKYAVIAAYAYAEFDQNEIVSLHKTHEAAEKSANGNSFAAIHAVSDDAKRGKNARQYRQ